MTPGTAFADTAVATATAITGTSQSPDPAGTTTLTVRVSVTPASGTAWPAGTVKVADTAGDSCKVTGSAASSQGWYGSGGPGSHSTAYVKIVPRGWWWAF